MHAENGANPALGGCCVKDNARACRKHGVHGALRTQFDDCPPAVSHILAAFASMRDEYRLIRETGLVHGE